MKISLAVFTMLGLLLSQLACAPGGGQSNTDDAARSAASPSTTVNDKDGANPSVADDARLSSEAQRYFDEGTVAYKANRDQEAVEAFQQAVRVQPDYPEAHLKLGLAFAALGQDDAADKEYQTAVAQYKNFTRRNPKDADAHFHLGLAHTKLGKHDEAVKAYREAVRLQPDDGDKQYELGLAHTKLAQYKEAVAALNKAIEIDPDNFRATDALERAQAGLGRREAFLKQQEKALKGQKAKPGASPETRPVALPQFKSPQQP
jgi:tetratricopeptide (TPR) repeat protein